MSVPGLLPRTLLELWSLSVPRARLSPTAASFNWSPSKKNGFQDQKKYSHKPLIVSLLLSTMKIPCVLFQKYLPKAFAIEIERVNLHPLREGTMATSQLLTNEMSLEAYLRLTTNALCSLSDSHLETWVSG
jgi:hypothetical protein